jgi:hypothetical protein
MKLVIISIALLLAQSAYAHEQCPPFTYNLYSVLSSSTDEDGQIINDSGQPLTEVQVDLLVGCMGEEMSHAGDYHTVVYRSPRGGYMLVTYFSKHVAAIAQNGLDHLD